MQRTNSFDQISEDIYLSIIVPTYNEENTIESVVLSIEGCIKEILGKSFEIIVVVDGATDNTLHIAKKTNAKVITLKENRGKGFALRVGFRAAKGSHFLTVDADGSHKSEDITKLICGYHHSKVDMLIGSRFFEKTKTRFTSCTNVVGNKIFGLILFLISGRKITDSQSGLRIFNRKLLSFLNLESVGYEVESELTAEVLGFGFQIEEIPIATIRRKFGKTHLNFFFDGIEILKTLVISYYKGKKRYQQFKNDRYF